MKFKYALTTILVLTIQQALPLDIPILLQNSATNISNFIVSNREVILPIYTFSLFSGGLVYAAYKFEQMTDEFLIKQGVSQKEVAKAKKERGWSFINFPITAGVFITIIEQIIYQQKVVLEIGQKSIINNTKEMLRDITFLGLMSTIIALLGNDEEILKYAWISSRH